jgi:hypothetical protein
MTLIEVTDIRECQVQWSEDGWNLAILMQGLTVYLGELEPPAEFDFIGHAESLGATPDEPDEFISQLRRGLDALKQSRLRQVATRMH